jgi:hypothetical protein
LHRALGDVRGLDALLPVVVVVGAAAVRTGGVVPAPARPRRKQAAHTHTQSTVRCWRVRTGFAAHRLSPPQILFRRRKPPPPPLEGRPSASQQAQGCRGRPSASQQAQGCRGGPTTRRLLMKPFARVGYNKSPVLGGQGRIVYALRRIKRGRRRPLPRA